MSIDNPIACKYCEEDIYFDDEQIAPSGKKIPIDSETDEPHRCSGRQAFYEKEKTFREDQQYTQRANERALLEKITALEKRVKALEDKNG